MGIAVVALVLAPASRPAFAADQAGAECQSAGNDFDRQIAACAVLLGRARLRPDIRSNAYNNRGFALLQQNRLDLAIADFSSALQINPRNLTARFNRYSTLQKKGDVAGALADLQIFISLKPPAQTAQQQMVQARNLFAVGELHYALQHFADAAKAWEAGIAIAANSVGPTDPYLLNAQQNLALALTDTDRLDEAEALCRTVIAKVETAEGRDSSNLAKMLNLLAEVLRIKVRLPEARAAVERSITLYEKSTGPESAGVADALVALGTINIEESRFDDSFKAYLKALAIREKVLGPESVDTAKVLSELGVASESIGRYRDAEDYSRRALKIITKIEGPDSTTLAYGLGNLANVYGDERRFAEEIAARKRVLAILEARLGAQSEPFAQQLSNLGTDLTNAGQEVDAEAVIKRSMAISQRNLGPDSPTVARTLSALARTLSDQKRDDEAVRSLGQAVSILQKVYGAGSPELAVPLSNQARSERKLKHFDQAIDLLQQASNVVRASDPATQAGIAKERALTEADQGKWAEAEAHHKEQLAIYARIFGADYPMAAGAWGQLGWLAEKQDDPDKALSLARKGAAIALKAEPTSTSSDNDWLWINVGSFAWAVAAKHPDQAAALSEEAFGATQRTQLGTAAAAVAQMAARFGAGSSNVASAVREQQDLAAQSHALDSKLDAALGSANQDGASLANLRTQIATVDARLKETTARIARDFPQYAELSSPKPLTLAETEALLRPDEALVTWLVGDDQILIFAVTRERADWRRVALPEKQLDEKVAKLRASLDLDKVTRGLARGDAGRDLVFSLADAHALYQQLLEPVQALVGPKKTLIVVPAGALTSLPLQVLVTEAPKRAATSMSDTAYGQAAWLAKSHAITVLPSVASLRALRAFAKPTQATEPLVGFADPVFGRSPDGTALRGGPARVADVGSYARYFRGGEVDVDALRTGLPALPETAGELRAVADQLHATGADLKFGEAATVTEVKALPLDRFRVVYFATHGLVAGDVKGLTEPALALTVPAHPRPADSGLLTASDVAQLKLDADWVVLSACNTASGDMPGAEGLSGLARAFFYAGARALLVSHWPVRSDAAVQLTTHAFAAMAADPTLDRADALRQSMLTLIATGGDNAYPAVWAPFVVVGEGGRGK